MPDIKLDAAYWEKKYKALLIDFDDKARYIESLQKKQRELILEVDKLETHSQIWKPITESNWKFLSDSEEMLYANFDRTSDGYSLKIIGLLYRRNDEFYAKTSGNHTYILENVTHYCTIDNYDL